jgi:molybdate transport system permease protein
MFLEPAELQALVLSLKVALICTLTVFPFAVLIAYVLAKRNFAGKIFVEGFLNLPMVLPPVTTGYLLLLLFGTNGCLGKFLYQTFDIKIAFTFAACVIASAVVSAPLVIRSAKDSFEMVDPE